MKEAILGILLFKKIFNFIFDNIGNTFLQKLFPTTSKAKVEIYVLRLFIIIFKFWKMLFDSKST